MIQPVLTPDFSLVACDGVTKGFGIEDSMVCTCGAHLVDGLHEVAGSLDCFTVTDSCLDDSNSTFCGGALFSAIISGGFGTSFQGTVNTCLGAQVPQDLGFYDVCIDAVFDETGLEHCDAAVNGQFCSCTPCDDGGKFAVVFDCSAVNLSPFPNIPLFGPKVDTCRLFDFNGSPPMVV